MEAFPKIEKLFPSEKIHTGGSTTRIIHVFDREGDIAEVFLELSKTQNTGVVVRAAHNRCLSGENSYLWSYVTSQPVQFIKEITLPVGCKGSIKKPSTDKSSASCPLPFFVNKSVLMMTR